MKLVISPTIRIGAVKHKVKFDDVLLEHDDLRGSYRVKDEIIRLASGRSPEQTWMVLIHEVLHICSNESGADSDENGIRGTATLLAQATLSMGIEPDFSRILGGKTK